MLGASGYVWGIKLLEVCLSIRFMSDSSFVVKLALIKVVKKSQLSSTTL